MANHYRITVEPLSADRAEKDAPLVFEAESHDDIIAIVRRMKEKGILPEEQVPAFVTGLKLFGGVMLKNRTQPLFSDFMGAFATFMKALKAA